MAASRPTVHDRLSLLALRYAKRNQPRCAGGSDGRFYDRFFSEDHLEQYDADLRNVLRHA